MSRRRAWTYCFLWCAGFWLLAAWLLAGWVGLPP